MKTRVYLSVGSNVDRAHNARSAVHALRELFGEIEISPVYESAAVGFDGTPFYNFIVAINTHQSITEIILKLKAIEDAHGRDRSGPKFSSRSLDIDVVLYGDLVGEHEGIELPRPELFYNAFVLLPMADLLKDEPEPKTGSSYLELVSTLAIEQEIERIDFDFDTKELTS